MANPNRCETCDYSKLNGNREKGHCYMFRDEPTDVCHQHTGRDFLRNFEATLRRQQDQLGEPFASILAKHLDELYETEDKGSNAKLSGGEAVRSDAGLSGNV